MKLGLSSQWKAWLWGSGLFFTGLALALGAFFFRLDNSGRGSPSTGASIAFVSPVVGVSFVTSTSGERRPARGKTSLFENESISTEEASQARISFPSGARVLLRGQTQVSVTRHWHESFWREELKVLSGSVQIEIKGEPALSVIEEKREVSWPEQLLLSRREIPLGSKAPTEVNGPSKEISEPSNARPNAEDVARRLSQRRPDFLKCFGTLLQKNHRARGLVDVTFTILPTGRISQPSARSEEIRDEAFQNCLFEVLQRVRFSAFAGEAVLAKFPLVFD